jgi:uncharacterized membrane protein
MEPVTQASALIASPIGVMACLAGIAAFFFWLARVTGWTLFKYLIPLIWIYAVPMVLSSTGVLPSSSPAYDLLGDYGLPVVIVLLLLAVDLKAAVRVMGRGIGVMLLGTLGVVVGAPVGYLVVHRWLAPEAWTGFGALSGSWIGGTGNLFAAAEALGAPAEMAGLAVLADSLIYIVWLPVLLASKSFADRFNRWARVPPERLARLEEIDADAAGPGEPPAIRHLLYLGAIGLGGTWLATSLAAALPELTLPALSLAGAHIPAEVVVSTGTWRILLVTTIGIALSFTGAGKIPGSHNLAMALLYVFITRMGAAASIEAFAEQALPFVAGAAIWIVIHGLFCLAGARLLRVDVHSVAIASAANIGGAASAPVVAAHHRENLVPASILMALVGYALGNYLAVLTGHLCRIVGAL